MKLTVLLETPKDIWQNFRIFRKIFGTARDAVHSKNASHRAQTKSYTKILASDIAKGPSAVQYTKLEAHTFGLTDTRKTFLDIIIRKCLLPT